MRGFVGQSNPATLGDGPGVYHNGRLYRTNSASQPWSLVVEEQYDRFEVRSGDKWPNDTTSERSELSNQRSPVAFDTDVWLSFGLRVTAPAITAGFFLIGQFRATDDAGDYAARSPVFAQELVAGGAFRVVTRSDPAATSTGNLLLVERFHDDAFVFGRKYQFVYRLRFSQAGNGELQGWRDGVEIIPTASIPMGYNDAVGPFFKYGIYRAPAAETVVAEYVNVELSTSSLAARVASPVSWPNV